jgi:selenobiotic family peptide radical SAM maturase
MHLSRDLPRPDPSLQAFVATELFTLQWHITQTCDLHCRHCYDRSDRTSLTLEQAMAIVDDFYEFCSRMHVRGQVTFTGGNPLLYPHFNAIYRAASQAGFGIAILGNPSPKGRIAQLLDIAHPHYFQISLEGLEAHNDYIRGRGHFQRSFAFLDDLQDLNVYRMVMLTLTRDNLDQVLPLADLLRDRTDHFTFNRLATVGEGAALRMPDIHEFQAFLKNYAQAAAQNPILGLKDNLFNLINQETGEPLIGGCTGFGCGAAFNFLALLPDGEVHACRKFPSPVGSIHRSSLYDIYHSEQATRYRAGSRACAGCSLNLVCRGCLAITHSLGLDVFTDKDPFCFAALEKNPK